MNGHENGTQLNIKFLKNFLKLNDCSDTNKKYYLHVTLLLQGIYIVAQINLFIPFIWNVWLKLFSLS